MTFQTALTSVDSYKLGHADMYPNGTTEVVSNFTPRSMKHLGLPAQYVDNKIVWFGLQAFLIEMKELWDETFFKLPWKTIEKKYTEFLPCL